MSACEICGRQAEYCCSGLDVPAVKFCAGCARIHELECPDVHSGAAVVLRMGESNVRKPKVPKELDAIADAVLAYRPKARSKPAVQRKRRKTILEKQRAKDR